MFDQSCSRVGFLLLVRPINIARSVFLYYKADSGPFQSVFRPSFAGIGSKPHVLV